MDFENFDLAKNNFYFYNPNLQPLTFVLDWDTKQMFYFKILNQFYADVIINPNDHTMVLAKPDNCTYFHPQIPAFDIKYIEDCFKQKDFPDPTKYMIQKSCPVKYTQEDIMDCWFFCTKSWFQLQPAKENICEYQLFSNKCSTINNSDSDETTIFHNREFASSTLSSKILNSDSDEINLDKQLPTSTRLKNKTLNKKTDNDESTIINRKPLARSNKNLRLPYSNKEDLQIVQYLTNYEYDFNIMGNKIWQIMEHKNVCKIRTWQSMKERYIKHIKFDLTHDSNKYSFLPPDKLKLLRKRLNLPLKPKRHNKILSSKFKEAHINDWLPD